jgi:fatty acid desaturase
VNAGSQQLGPAVALFVYVVPVLVANATVMSYIATEHFLNPPTETNDPLANTFSVTAPRWLERLRLQFGCHVEHHLFPTVSGRHAPAVREVLRRLYGRYLTMPLARALRVL